MPLIFGLDIGTTSVGFAVIDHDHHKGTGTIRRMGVRIFPEARDPKGAPLNQERRAARMRRRQLRRRRERRRALERILSEASLLPTRESPQWRAVMKTDPYCLRRRAAAGEALTPHELGRALYHLAQRRHFKGRDIDEVADDTDDKKTKAKQDGEDADEKKAKSAREETVQALKRDGGTLGAWLSERGPHERRRDVHAERRNVEEEFNVIWQAQTPHLPLLKTSGLKEALHEAVFAQRPTFWRKNTLGECRLIPGAALCPKGSWLSQQRRMLEKLNNLEVAGGNARPLDAQERAAILDRLQTQASMTWPGVRRALAPLFKAAGEAGAEKRLKFNLEDGGERNLFGNAVEAKLGDIFGGGWDSHPHRQAIRDRAPARLREADYGELGGRVVIRSARKRRESREAAAREFVRDFGATEEQARKLSELKLPSGWEPFSVEALQALLPRLEEGARFGALLNGPEWEDWRNETFPNREGPTGEVLDRLPSPTRKNRDELERMKRLRNPTVARAQNELRKVVNNLIDMFGKPDLIRLELTREVGRSKRDREEYGAAIRRQEGQRRKAGNALVENGIASPSRADIEKWMLWEECGHRCPYTGDHICFDDLFCIGKFEVEHIWPRSRSLDNSFRNKTLCRLNVNREKGNRTPREAFGGDKERWAAIGDRLDGMKASRGGVGMSPGKVRRFMGDIPEDFASRQLNDTGYAARETAAFLKRLWPDIGPDAPVTVQAVSGRVTGHLRRLWGLNNILSDDGEKTRADHRHHAVDALVVACARPGMTNGLSRYWQAKDDPYAPDPPALPPPWPSIRADAERAVTEIVVSHRVRKKLSGPLHKEKIYGNTGEEQANGRGPVYRYFVKRKKVESLSKNELAEIRDEDVRRIVSEWVAKHGGDPKKAFQHAYPKRGRKGPPIRKVRLLKKQQIKLMAPVSTGYADLGNNHHIAIYRMPNGAVEYEVVSLFEASQRLARGESIVRRNHGNGAQFVMSLSLGDALVFSKLADDEIWIVNKLSANGQISLRRHIDAGTMDRLWSPSATTFVEKGAKKLSIDPIGCKRWAND